MFSELFDETPEGKEVRVEHDSDNENLVATHRRQNRCPQTVVTGSTQGFREHDLQCQERETFFGIAASYDRLSILTIPRFLPH